MNLDSSLERLRSLNWKDHRVQAIAVLSLFYACSLETFTTMEDTWLDLLFRPGRYLSYALMAFLILRYVTQFDGFAQSIKKLWVFVKDHILFDVMFVLSCIACLSARVIEPLIFMLLCLFVMQLDIKTVIRVFFWTCLVIFMATIVMGLLHLIPHLTFLRKEILRYSLGFIYPLECNAMYFFLTMAGCYLYGEKLGWKLYVPGAVFISVLTVFTKSRFSYVLTLMVIVVFWALNLWHARNPKQPGRLCASRGFMAFTVFVVVFLFVFPNLFACYYQWGNPIWEAVNKLFNDRFIWGRKAYAYMELKPFGTYIKWVGFGGQRLVQVNPWILTEYNYVDISYIKNLFDYGPIYMFFIFCMYLYTLIHYESKKAWGLVIIVFGAMGICLFEARLLQVSCNLALPVCACFITLSNSDMFNGWKNRKTRKEPVVRA